MLQDIIVHIKINNSRILNGRENIKLISLHKGKIHPFRGRLAQDLDIM